MSTGTRDENGSINLNPSKSVGLQATESDNIKSGVETSQTKIMDVQATTSDEKSQKKINDGPQTQSVEIMQSKSTVSQPKTVDVQTNEIAEKSKSKTTILSQTKSVDIHTTNSENTYNSKSKDSNKTRSINSESKISHGITIIEEDLTKSPELARSADTIVTVDQRKMKELKRVCVIGARNWGTVIAKIIGTNITNVESFNNEVLLYVQEELIEGKNLTDIINETHENVKYLPGYQLPDNVVAVSDAVEAAKDANIIIFTLQQEYITLVCNALIGKIKPTAAGVCLTKGFELTEDGNVDLFSQIITRHLKIQTSVLMGANLCDEIARGKYCEATIGCKDKLLAATLKDLIQTDYLRVTVVDDVDAVEVCGSLRNVIACGVGFMDGLDMGRGIKATVIRIGLIEMIKFVDLFYPGSKISTFFESCGVADLATCYLAGRNREISEKFVSTKRSISEIEKEMLEGHTLEGPSTAKKLHFMIRERDLEYKFPLFTAVYKVYAGELEPAHFLDNVLGNAEHFNVRLHHLTW